MKQSEARFRAQERRDNWSEALKWRSHTAPACAAVAPERRRKAVAFSAPEIKMVGAPRFELGTF
jgi:hypothetical protein